MISRGKIILAIWGHGGLGFDRRNLPLYQVAKWDPPPPSRAQKSEAFILPPATGCVISV
jgi:hypothetical protein